MMRTMSVISCLNMNYPFHLKKEQYLSVQTIDQRTFYACRCCNFTLPVVNACKKSRISRSIVNSCYRGHVASIVLKIAGLLALMRLISFPNSTFFRIMLFFLSSSLSLIMIYKFGIHT